MRKSSLMAEIDDVDELNDEGGEVGVGERVERVVVEVSAKVSLWEVFEDEDSVVGVSNEVVEGDDGRVGGDERMEVGFVFGDAPGLDEFESCK